MRYSAARLNKLKGRSLGEIIDRVRQRITILWDRLAGSMRGEMTDAQMMEELLSIPEVSRWQSVSIDDILPGAIESVKRRIARAPAIPALAERNRIREMVEYRWPSERSALIQAADLAAAGRFNIFGLPQVDFGTPIKWRLEPVSGKCTELAHWSQIDYLNPSVAGDKKVTWELNRHAHFVVLAQAYCLTKNEDYTRALVRQATAWMDQNPPEMGINWTSSLEVALRAIAWIWALHLAIDSTLLGPRFVSRVFKFLIAHANHIEAYLSTYFSPNTHLTGEALGLFYIGTCFPEFRRAEAWRQKGLKILEEQLPLQVKDDGVYFEQSSYYHRYTVDFYLHLLILGRGAGIGLSSRIQDSLTKMIEYLVWTTRPDACPTLLGDDDGGRLLSLGSRDPYDFRDSIGIAAGLLGREDWKYVAGEQVPEILWLLGPPRVDFYDRLESRQPSQLAHAFQNSGQYVVRSGWNRDSLYCFFRCGPHAALTGAHAHADQLSFELSGAGATWLVDPGTYTYTLDPGSRNQFRLTAGHNVITVDGLPQSRPAGPFAWEDQADGKTRIAVFEPEICYLSGTQNGYDSLADPVKHERSISLIASGADEGCPPYLAVTDTVESIREHSYDVWYHFAPQVIVESDDNCFRAVNEYGQFLFINQFSTVPFKLRTEIGRVSERYRQATPAMIGKMSAVASGRHRFTSVMFPVSSKSEFTPQVQGTGSGNIITVRYGNVTDLLLLDSPDGAQAGIDIHSQARLAVARRVGPGWRGAGVVAGTELALKGVFRVVAERELDFAYADLGQRVLRISTDQKFGIDLVVQSGIDRVEMNGEVFRVPATRHIRYQDGAWVPVINNEESEYTERVRG